MPSIRPIRLFVDAHVFDKEYQGTRTYLKELYTRLIQKPGIIFYFGAHDTLNLADHFPAAPNIRFVSYKNKSSLSRLLLQLPAVLEKHQVDLAHFQYIVPPRKRCRYLVTIHDVIFEEFPSAFSYSYRLTKKILYRHAAHKADLLSTVSSFSSNSIAKHLETGTKSIHIIPNAVSDRYFEPYDKMAARKLLKERFGLDRFILCVSRIEPRKNHFALLKSFLDLELYKKGIQLVFLGHKSLAVPELEKLMAAMDPEARKSLVIKDDINDSDLVNFYRACEVFVYPSLAEGFGISPLEAAACRVPVICSSGSAMSEFTFFGKDHVDPINADQITRRLHFTLENMHSEETLNNIAGRIRRDYSWDSSADKLHALITNYFSSLSKTKTRNDKLQLS